MQNTQQTIIVKTQKSPGIAALLGFFFGPLGMLYATGIGALIMFIITALVIVFTAGLGLIITNPICAIWAYISVKNKNSNVSLHNENPKKEAVKKDNEDLFN